MTLPGIYYRAKRRGLQTFHRTFHRGRAFHRCPLCTYEGPFEDWDWNGFRRAAVCPACGSQERHRLQWLVMSALPERRRYAEMSFLHCAPDWMMVHLFRGAFGKYVTADPSANPVDLRVDLRKMAFRDATFDVIYASHVLEHIREDEAAFREIHRVLKPGGFAVLPVPIVNEKTVEYPMPNPHEWGHVRAPGPDYHERMRKYFSRVEVYSSAQFDARHQLYLYEDRTVFPTKKLPLRHGIAGERHVEFVPVCYR